MLKELNRKVKENDVMGASLLIFEIEDKIAEYMYDKKVKELSSLLQDLRVARGNMQKTEESAKAFEFETHMIWVITYLIKKYLKVDALRSLEIDIETTPICKETHEKIQR